MGGSSRTETRVGAEHHDAAASLVCVPHGAFTANKASAGETLDATSFRLFLG